MLRPVTRSIRNAFPALKHQLPELAVLPVAEDLVAEDLAAEDLAAEDLAAAPEAAVAVALVEAVEAAG